MIAKYFGFDVLKTNFKNEVIGGATTFITMAYIIIVNPKILEAAGMPFEASMIATIISAFFGTLIMGIYAKRPFAIAPYMGENAFIAYTVVKVLGYSWQAALGAIFIGGVLFTILTVLNIRSWMANAIPVSLKISFAVGIGFFLTFIGLNTTGIVTLGVPGAPLDIGDMTNPNIYFAIIGFLIIGFLMIRKVTGAILLGILITTILGYIFGVTPLPKDFVSLPPDISPVFLKLDIAGAFQWGFFSVILLVFIADFIDTMGTLIGVGYKAGLLDKEGNLPEIEKPFLADALATIAGSLLGTTTTGTYIESAAGISAGAKSGFASVVTAFLFLTALFFAPFFTSVPTYAYGSALILVGLLMISPIRNLDFDNLPEAIPAFLTIILMSFTYNLGVGLTAGLITYPITKIIAGEAKDITAGMWILFLLAVLFYGFYPY